MPSAPAGTSSVIARAGGDIGVLAHGDRRDERGVAADERAVFDDGPVLGGAVVIARDRARADVDLGADGRVAEIREVVGLAACAQRRVLELDEVADVRVLADVGARSQMRERTDDARPAATVRIGDHRVIADDDAIADASS